MFREGARVRHGKPQEEEEEDEEEGEEKEETEIEWCSREVFVEPVEWMRPTILGTMEGKVR